MTDLPSPSELAPIIVVVLDELGGKAHFKDIEIAVAQHLNLEAELVKIVRSGKRTEFAYRMSWARTACKGKGLIRNLGKGIWEKT